MTTFATMAGAAGGLGANRADLEKPANSVRLLKDRIKRLDRVPGKDLLPNPKNWRTHPDNQAVCPAWIACRSRLRKTQCSPE